MNIKILKRVVLMIFNQLNKYNLFIINLDEKIICWNQKLSTCYKFNKCLICIFLILQEYETHRPKTSDTVTPSTLPPKIKKSFYSPSSIPRSTTPVKIRREKEQKEGYQIVSHDNENGIFLLRNNSSPSKLLIKRTKEKAEKEPERLKIDNHELKVFPIIADADKVKVLSLEHNYIERIENINYIRYIVYLDLYDNGIKVIENLDVLSQLRVLMLGRNDIKIIEGLSSLTQLDVLDLHSNDISVV